MNIMQKHYFYVLILQRPTHNEKDEKIFFVKKIVFKKPQYYTANNLQ